MITFAVDTNSDDRNARPASQATSGGIDANYHFESVVCDLHSTALQIGAISCLLNAHAKTGGQRTLRAWRHLLHDNSGVVHLGLRRCHEIGVAAEVGARINRMYSDLSEAIATTRALSSNEKLAGGPPRSLTNLAAAWRQLAQHAIEALRGVAPDVKRRLVDNYSADDKILARFLSEAVSGDTRRVSASGDISLPDLSQSRRAPRVAVRWPCQLAVCGETAPAMLLDVSTGGVGLSCRHPIADGQRVTIEFEDGRRLDAQVAWRTGDRLGLTLAKPLSIGDPLLKR